MLELALGNLTHRTGSGPSRTAASRKCRVAVVDSTRWTCPLRRKGSKWDFDFWGIDGFGDGCTLDL
eukprot:2963413-Amphidinium_carterae.1